MSDSTISYPDILLESARRLPSRERAQEMLDIDLGYAACFFNRDFDGMEKHLVDNPDYEMQPLGLRITGRDAVRERSERLQAHTIAQIDPRSAVEETREIRSVAYGEDVMVVEWSNDFTLPDGSRKRCYSVAIIPYEGDKMVGERVYTCQNFAELRKHALGEDFTEVDGVTKL